MAISPRRFLRRRLPRDGERRADGICAALLVALALISGWDMMGGGTVAGMDAITQFYPWYAYLGESLRSGEIPAWNPSQFSGAPFAGSPLSGWGYLPAMVLFTVLPLGAATKGYLLTHLLLAGLGTYALARALRMNAAGALVAGVSYGFSSYLFFRSACCFAFVGVYAWLPLLLLGAELAIRSTRWLDRALWWGVGGLAISQVLAAYPGQGSYYALLCLGGFVAYRTVLFPPDNFRGLLIRIPNLLLNGGGLLLFGFALAAAGIFPLLEYNALSSLAGGYAGEGGTEPTGGWSLQDWKSLMVAGNAYIGLPILALALAAPFIARARHATPFFVFLSLGALTLSGQGPTLLHSALYKLLPVFDQLHPHEPQRVTVVLYLGIALLAGATVSALGERGKSAGALASLPFLAALFLMSRVEITSLQALVDFVGFGDSDGRAISSLWNVTVPVILLILILALVTFYALIPEQRTLLAAALILALFINSFLAERWMIEDHERSNGGGQFLDTNLSAYYGPRGDTEFLKSQTAGDEGGPARYFVYDHIPAGDGSFAYAMRFANGDNTVSLLANSGATVYGLQSVQGYDAVHLAIYDEYIAALNGGEQNRHFSDVFPDGLDSPLLDLLNARYVVIPAVTRPFQDDLRQFAQSHPTVYKDSRTRILANRDALPRAWIVHSSRQTTPEKALDLLASGKVDPRETALLERQTPELTRPDETSSDTAAVETYEANRMQIRTRTGAAGLLVLSEVYYPAWKAYVDGEPTSLYRADHLFRAIPVPAGEHTVELRFESRALTTGIIVSLAAGVILTVLLALKVRRWRKTAVEAKHATSVAKSS